MLGWFGFLFTIPFFLIACAFWASAGLLILCNWDQFLAKLPTFHDFFKAENIFWLARYIERAENLARILDVHATFSRDSRGGQTWLPVLQLNADEARFFKTHDTVSAEAVLRRISPRTS